MKMGEHKKLSRSSVYIWLLVFLSAIPSAAQASYGGDSSDGNALFVLASNIEAPVENSDPIPTVLYRVSSTTNLVSKAVVLKGSSTSGAQNWLPEGVLTINEAGRYLIVEYPHDVPCCLIFIPEDNPEALESIRVVPNGMTGLNCGLSSVASDDSQACSLWMLTPFGPPELLVQGKIGSTLQSVCKRGSQPHYTVADKWEDLTHLRFDGVTPLSRQCYLTSQDGMIQEYVIGRAPIFITAMPKEAPASKKRKGLTLDAADRHFRVISINDSDGVDGNSEVFAQSIDDGDWKRLPVPPVRLVGTDPTKIDRMSYRLFDDWLVTSASAAVLEANQIKETLVPDVITAVSTGKEWKDWGIKEVPRTAPDAATRPARRITLWNLADERRIDLALPEDDSEIVHVFDNRQVLLRIHDKLFFAEIDGSKLMNFKLAAFDSAIPRVHWAFYSSNGRQEN